MTASWSVNISASPSFKELECHHETELLWFLSSQESLEFSEGADLIWTVRGDEFDQVRCKKKIPKTKEQCSHLDLHFLKTN